MATDNGQSSFRRGVLSLVILGLLKLAEDGTAGNLEHPIWGIRYCYLTKLTLTQEPRADYVSYSFEFTQALANGEVPK